MERNSGVAASNRCRRIQPVPPTAAAENSVPKDSHAMRCQKPLLLLRSFIPSGNFLNNTLEHMFVSVVE